HPLIRRSVKAFCVGPTTRQTVSDAWGEAYGFDVSFRLERQADTSLRVRHSEPPNALGKKPCAVVLPTTRFRVCVVVLEGRGHSGHCGRSSRVITFVEQCPSLGNLCELLERCRKRRSSNRE